MMNCAKMKQGLCWMGYLLTNVTPARDVHPCPLGEGRHTFVV